MRSGTELAREMQLTDWSTAREQGKLVFVVSIKPSLAQFISLFTARKNRLSIVQITHQFQVFHFKISVKKKRRKEIVLTKFFVTSIQFVACALWKNRSSGLQIRRGICTLFGLYLYSTKCSWIIILSSGAQYKWISYFHVYPSKFFTQHLLLSSGRFRFKIKNQIG